jgi:Bacteriophage clamp loader A subunit
MASKLFPIINAISVGDRSILDDPDLEKEYIPFIVNRAFSYHEDSVLAANMMNERPFLEKRLQAAYFLNTLRTRKRFAKWLKNESDEDVAKVAEYYGCSYRHAKSLLALHTPEQLAVMDRRIDKGGR